MEGNIDLGHPHKTVCFPLGLSVGKKRIEQIQ